MKDTRRYTDEMASAWLCLEHWNEIARHQPEHDYLTRLIDSEADRRDPPVLTLE